MRRQAIGVTWRCFLGLEFQELQGMRGQWSMHEPSCASEGVAHRRSPDHAPTRSGGLSSEHRLNGILPGAGEWLVRGSSSRRMHVRRNGRRVFVVNSFQDPERRHAGRR